MKFMDNKKNWSKHQKMETENMLNVFDKKKKEMCLRNTRNINLTWVGIFRRIVWDKAGKGSWDMMIL